MCLRKVTNYPDLIFADLSSNRVENLKPLFEDLEKGFFKVLQILNLQNNQRIQELGALKCPNLLELNLEGNSIQKLESFEGHAKLEYLNLASNKIADLNSVKAMPNLKRLLIVSV